MHFLSEIVIFFYFFAWYEVVYLTPIYITVLSRTVFNKMSFKYCICIYSYITIKFSSYDLTL